MAAAAQKYKMFLCVQDLTCPGASLIHSAGLAAHVPGVAAIEANARQYVPAANKAWEARFPGLFRIRGGFMDTGHPNRPWFERGLKGDRRIFFRACACFGDRLRNPETSREFRDCVAFFF